MGGLVASVAEAWRCSVGLRRHFVLGLLVGASAWATWK